jgi:hypothetical protein
MASRSKPGSKTIVLAGPVYDRLATIQQRMEEAKGRQVTLSEVIERLFEDAETAGVP